MGNWGPALLLGLLLLLDLASSFSPRCIQSTLSHLIQFIISFWYHPLVHVIHTYFPRSLALTRFTTGKPSKSGTSSPHLPPPW